MGSNLLHDSRMKFKSHIPYNHSIAPLFIRSSLFSLIPEGTEHIYVVGIGSNRIIGDSLGPFVGTLLQDIFPNHLTVLGNLQNPLDAETLVSELSNITFPKNSFVIAVDSVLGNKDMVNNIVVRNGPLLPGVGLGQTLPPVGDCSIMGVVLERSVMIGNSLFLVNLDLIFSMATVIAKGISLTVRQYFKYNSDQPF